MKQRISFAALIQIWGIISLIGLGACIVAIDVIGSYRDFHMRADQMRTDHIARRKQMIKREVHRVVDMIHHKRAQSEAMTKSKIKARVYEAYAIAQNIYQQNKNVSSIEEIKRSIPDALRPIRFEQNKGYYFIVGLDGLAVLFPSDTAVEGSNIIGRQDSHGRYTSKDLIKIVRDSGEGFYRYHWTKPNAVGADFKKISYVKRFEPYDWFIGTGLYVDDVENQIEADLLTMISKIRFGKEGYIFINQLNGDVLVSNGKLFSGEKKLWEIFNDDPEYMKSIFEKELKAALKPEGDYIYYSHVKLTAPHQKSQKASFIYGIKDLQWLVGAGVYLDDVETDIAMIQAGLNRQIKRKVLYFILIVTGMVVFFSVFFNQVNRRLKTDFKQFISFFSRAARSDEEIDRENVKFIEFDQLATYANDMLKNRKQAEAALFESEEKYRELVENAASIILKWDLDGKILFLNEYGLKFCGFHPEDIVGKPIIGSLIPETDAKSQNLTKSITDIFCNPSQHNKGIHTITKRDGNQACIAWTNRPIYDDKKRITGMFSVGTDITELKQAEERQAYLQGKLVNALEMAHLGHWEYDVASDRFTFNDHFYKIFRTSSKRVGGDTMSAAEYAHRFVHPGDAAMVKEEIQKAIDTTDPCFNRQLEHRILYADGAVGYISVRYSIMKDAHGRTIKMYGVNQDITDRKIAENKNRENEEKLARYKKMESLGLLAGGVAHDLNNVLSGIVSYPELLLMNLPKDSKLRKPIEMIQASGNRAAAIVQDLLTVARGVASAKEPLDLNDIIQDYLQSPEFVKLEQFHPEVVFETHLAPNLLHLKGSRLHIRKVVMNLISNAAEAIKGNGNVTVSTMNRYVDRPFKGYSDISVGEYVVLAVSDNGPGISSNNLERIFEPFYTRKVMGKSGTGLGLAVVWNVMQDQKGFIDVSSDKSGTTFEMYFPMTRDEIRKKGEPLSPEAYKGNGQTILVVDDMENQREISCELLDQLGYKSKAVPNGEEAVEYLKNNTVDLVLLDMIMDPGINGRQTYEKILEIHPNQKAIIASGFSETEEVKRAQQIGAGQYVKKPFTLEKLGIAVKEELVA